MIFKGKRANSTTLKPLELEPLPPIESSKDSSFTQILLYILASAFLVVLFVGIVYCLAKCRWLSNTETGRGGEKGALTFFFSLGAHVFLQPINLLCLSFVLPWSTGFWLAKTDFGDSLESVRRKILFPSNTTRCYWKYPKLLCFTSLYYPVFS